MSVGAGVCQDNVNLRLTYYDDTAADAQYDGLEYRYDLSKIWSTMGRADVNLVNRYALIEEPYQYGNPPVLKPQCAITTYIAAAWAGANYWDTITAYPICGVNIGDCVLFGNFHYSNEVWVHLNPATYAAVQPTVVYEYISAGPAWTAFTPAQQIDFTGATGPLQKLRLPTSGLPSLVPTAPFAAGGAPENEVRFWVRIRLTGNAPAAQVMANFNYKDFLRGYFRHYFCTYDLKRGDDGAGSMPTFFRDDDFSLRFANGRITDSRVNLANVYQFGTKYHGTSSSIHRPSVGRPWSVVVQGTRQTIFHNANLYGGAVFQKPPWAGSTTPGVVIRGGAVGSGEIVGMFVSGAGQNSQLGAGAGTGVRRVDGVRWVKDPGAVRALNSMNVDPVDANAFVRDVYFDSHANEQQLINAIISGARFEGMTFAGDYSTLGQITGAATGYRDIVCPRWGGPNRKIGSAAFGTNPFREWWRLRFRIFEPDFSAFPGVGLKITDSVGTVQLPVGSAWSDVNGRIWFFNRMTGAPSAVQIRNQNLVCASSWEDGNLPPAEVLRDNPLEIVLNDPTDPNYLSDWQTVTIRTRFPREWYYDAWFQQWGELDWQRTDCEISVVMQPKTAGGGGGGDCPQVYVRQIVPSTTYQSQAGADTPYSGAAVPNVVYQRQPDPTGLYVPCGVVGAPAFTAQGAPATPFSKVLVPDVEYAECGAAFPDRILLIGPWMPMRVAGT